MGLTERHLFENEDVPENYEWALEDAVYNSRTNKKADIGMTGPAKVIEELMQLHGSKETMNIISNAIALLKEQDECENCAVAIEDRQPVVRCRDCKHAVLTSRGEVKYCQFWQEDEDGNFGGDPLYLDGDFFCAGGERRGAE